MTPAELAVERDRLLEGGRTLEEVEAMQLVAGSTFDGPWRQPVAPASEDAEGAQIQGGRRCAIYRHWDDWWVGISPRNGHGSSVEGPWEDWVRLALRIVAVESTRRLSLLVRNEAKP